MEYRTAIGAWVFGCDICQDVCPPTMIPHLSSAEERRAWSVQTRELIRRTNAGTYAVTNGGVKDHVPGTGHSLHGDRITASVDLVWLLRLTHTQYLDAFRGTAIRRAKVWMLRRNAAIALGNTGGPDHLTALAQSTMQDEHSLVRGHAAWALGQLSKRHNLPKAAEILERALRTETDQDVCAEQRAALEVVRGRASV